MRIIPYAETVKRGCKYCAFVDKTLGDDGKMKKACPYEECPYRELDDYKTYNEFLKARYNNERRLF